MTGTFPYYSDGVAGEKYGAGNYKATNGRLYKVTTSGTGTPLAWYPAPGFRDVGSTNWEGLTRGVGGSGYSWVSTSYDSDDYYCCGLCLSFSVTWLYPGYAYSRACGLQLRCLSE